MNFILKAYTLSQCMEIMAEKAAAHEALGEKNLIFCEDRLTLLAERALLKAKGGTYLSTVTTFARFLKSDQKTISKQGSVMAVGDVMTRLQRENVLQCFTSASSVGNNAKCIYETLAQLSASEVTPELLRESLSSITDDMLCKKVHDLAAIYEGYTAFLQERNFLDESKYLALLPAYLKNFDDIKNTNVFFLCFNSFTAQASGAIHAALESAKNVVGIFCSGEEDIYANQALTAFKRVFSRAKERGEKLKEPKEEQCGKQLLGEAEILRKGLFNPESLKETKKEIKNIHLYEAGDKTAEAEYVAVNIRRALYEDSTLRYRDIAVLLSDVAGYSMTLKKAFKEYNIPYFIDEKKSLKCHPLSRFLLDCFKTVRERFSPLAVQSLTQNFFFGESDEYRNYLLKYANYRGGAKRAIKTDEVVADSFDVSALESGRERLLLATQHIKNEDSGKNYCEVIRKILADFDVEKSLETLSEDLHDISQKGYLAQIYRALNRVLEEAELLISNRKMKISEFEAVLSDGLDATEISLIPLKADAVFIGDITDSRIEDTKLLFAMGMTSEIPRSGSDTAIVSDKEIEKLVKTKEFEEIKTRLEPTVAEVNLRNRESACLNLCSFLQELHLSYSLSADGSEPALSEVFRYIDRLFYAVQDEKSVKPIKEKGVALSYEKYKYSALTPAIRQLLIEESKRKLMQKKAEEDGASAETDNQEGSLVEQSLEALGVPKEDARLAKREGHVCVERGEELFFKDGKISPTALEKYFSCPFKHFVERGLKLKEREETAVLALDTGNFVHNLLKAAAENLAGNETDAKIKGEIESKEISTEEGMRAFAMEKGSELLKDSVYSMQQDTDSGNFFSEKLLAEAVEVTLAMFQQMKNSKFTVVAAEKWIGSEFFRGQVDRMDATDKYVRVIDYKTGSIDDSASSYYTGQKIQMQLYMSEMKGDKIPAGVFYFPASTSYDNEGGNKFQMKGFLNGDSEALQCGDINLTETTKSPYFPAALKNNKSTHVMEEEVFRDFLDYSIHVARQGHKELKEGFIAPSPYKGNCKYCKYGGLCGFNKDVGTERKETGRDITPKMIAGIAREKREGGDE